jgi:hypothetical protein
MADYFGKPITPIVEDYKKNMAVVVELNYDDEGHIVRKFSQNVPIEHGVVRWTQEPQVELKNGMLVFVDENLQSQLDKFWNKWENKNDFAVA